MWLSQIKVCALVRRLRCAPRYAGRLARRGSMYGWQDARKVTGDCRGIQDPRRWAPYIIVLFPRTWLKVMFVQRFEWGKPCLTYSVLSLLPRRDSPPSGICSRCGCCLCGSQLLRLPEAAAYWLGRRRGQRRLTASAVLFRNLFIPSFCISSILSFIKIFLVFQTLK